jgi:hypothetical protein
MEFQWTTGCLRRHPALLFPLPLLPLYHYVELELFFLDGFLDVASFFFCARRRESLLQGCDVLQ